MAEPAVNQKKAPSSGEIAAFLERSSVWLGVLSELGGGLVDLCKRLARAVRAAAGDSQGGGA